MYELVEETNRQEKGDLRIDFTLGEENTAALVVRTRNSHGNYLPIQEQMVLDVRDINAIHGFHSRTT